MKHALVIGGSGMLAQVSLWLANYGYTVSVIGRDHSKLERLATAHQQIVPLAVDYNDEHHCRAAVRQSLDSHGAYDIVVAWIHGGIETAERVVEMLQSELNRVHAVQWTLFHVISSRTDGQECRQRMNAIADCEYYQIQLGFVIDTQRSRWLTNEEIAGGVIECMRKRDTYYLVGTLTPWESRP
ncbi:SDR family NAD(P)-dependent oxidoreductase [Paenibacillus campi]|uniref:SDR family NAD(P)-dependent oxidoreductase n=1 Tax=Paenibacillus campi TaxID=3106031 RepID=UPI002B003CFD|nr:SDR family NAD(P)-dependent oxidoreductase [Paenibacillus sp. SGZ-1014]